MFHFQVCFFYYCACGNAAKCVLSLLRFSFLRFTAFAKRFPHFSMISARFVWPMKARRLSLPDACRRQSDRPHEYPIASALHSRLHSKTGSTSPHARRSSGAKNCPRLDAWEARESRALSSLLPFADARTMI
jgi:hypothetical protein